MLKKSKSGSRIYHLSEKQFGGMENSENVYGMYKSELYSDMFPNLSVKSACRIMRKLIQQDPELKEALKAANFNKRSHILTPLQVRILYKYIGRP